MSTETLHFKIGLCGTYWGKRPEYSILVNDVVVSKGQVESATKELFYVEFDSELPEGPATLKVRLENKTDDDVVKDDDTREDYTIVDDMLLAIKSVEIDEISLGNLLYEKSQYVADDSSRPTLTECVDFGWNGTWIFPFDSPFYIWLLENI
jgi:hypothetical protein